MAAPTIEEFLQMLNEAEMQQKREEERNSASKVNIPLEVPEMNEKVEENIEENIEEKVEESVEEKTVKKQSLTRYKGEEGREKKRQENLRYRERVKARMEVDAEYREKIIAKRRVYSVKRAAQQKEERRLRRLQRQKEAAENALTEQQVFEMINGMM